MGKGQSKLSPDKLNELLLSTRFSQKDLAQWYKGWSKDCPKGSLERLEFQKMYKQYFPFGDSSTYSRFVFALLDTNGDGQLSFDEFIAGMDVSTKGTVEERLECTRSFKLFDLDEDGYISSNEMLCIVDAIYRMVGDLDFPEDEATPELRVAKLFKLLDMVWEANKDCDGKVSKQEFIEASKQDPQVLDSLNFYAGMM